MKNKIYLHSSFFLCILLLPFHFYYSHCIYFSFTYYLLLLLLLFFIMCLLADVRLFFGVDVATVHWKSVFFLVYSRFRELQIELVGLLLGRLHRSEIKKVLQTRCFLSFKVKQIQRKCTCLANPIELHWCTPLMLLIL